MAKRYLGVDVGTKRIGLAIGDVHGVVSPLKNIAALGEHEVDARAICEAADEYGADAIVVGLPLNMDDSEGPQAKYSQVMAATIEKLWPAHLGSTAPEVHLYDERLTSHAADLQLAERELTNKQKKARQDSIAAQIILQSFFAYLRAQSQQ